MSPVNLEIFPYNPSTNKKSGAYVYYEDLYLTNSGKLILCESNNSGMEDRYSFCDNKVASRLLVDGKAVLDEKLAEVAEKILKEFEVA